MTLVLLSGGLDSAVLLAHEARETEALPVYVSVGLAWEAAELAMLDRLLARAPFAGRVAPLKRIELTMLDVYAPTHWAVRGTPPAYDTPDEDVYLAGRNLVLLTKAGIVAAQQHATTIALGPLAGNPFPDAQPAFFDAMSQSLSIGLASPIAIRTPFSHLHKEDVIRLGVDLEVPLELTLSCMAPVLTGNGAVPLHCGQCSKCRERRDAFAAAGVADPTAYAAPSPR